MAGSIQLLAFGAVGDCIVPGQHPIGMEERVQSLLNTLCERHPAAQGHIDDPRFRVAVNQQVVGLEHILQTGDEVALLSPVSGG